MKLFILSFVFFCTLSSSSMADEIIVGVEDFEPYFIEHGHTGIIPDLIKAVFVHIPGHQPTFVFGHSNTRLLFNFKRGKIDAVPNLNKSEKFYGCISDPAFEYRNYAITLASSNIKLEKISDLSGRSMITFQGAKDVLGPEFVSSINEDQYNEIINPAHQPRILFRERAEVSVGDRLIFLHSLKISHDINARAKDFNFHDIFPEIHTYMGFHDKKLCSLFNAGLKLIKQNGEYEKIYQSYLDKLQ